MNRLRFSKELYSKVALLKSAYNYTDVAFFHLDADEQYYYVEFEMKPGEQVISEKEFTNEMLSQSVRHEIYIATKAIRELLLARAMATSVVLDDTAEAIPEDQIPEPTQYDANDILKDWFELNEGFETEP